MNTVIKKEKTSFRQIKMNESEITKKNFHKKYTSFLQVL